MVSSKNILITGANGQLGKSLIKHSKIFNNFNFYFKKKDDLDITNFEKLENFISKSKIDTIINCASYNDVDNADKFKDVATKINVISVDFISKLCLKYDIKLVHISSDYVFDGNKNIPYTELDIPNPINFYGLTKYLGEKKILNANLKNSIIIRTSWLYSNYDSNFVTKIIENLKKEIEFEVTSKHIGSPTSCDDLSFIILKILNKIQFEKTQIFHYANSGYCSRYEFALEINKIVNPKFNFVKDQQNNFYSNVKRPTYSALSSIKISKKFNLDIINWKSSLYNLLINE